MKANEKNILRILEALIFASDKAISLTEIKKRVPECKEIRIFM